MDLNVLLSEAWEVALEGIVVAVILEVKARVGGAEEFLDFVVGREGGEGSVEEVTRRGEGEQVVESKLVARDCAGGRGRKGEGVVEHAEERSEFRGEAAYKRHRVGSSGGGGCC